MARMRSWCPRCGKIVPAGERCACSTSRAPRRDTRGKRDRSAEPWRREYGRAEYQAARQIAIQRTRGRCTDCGLKVATFDGRRWKVAGGEVDHIRALSEGGDNSAGNLALRCIPCHRRRDEARRRAAR